MSLVVLAGGVTPSHAQGQAGSGVVSLQENVTRLAALDYPVRMQAARLIRREPGPEAVKALVEAARRDSNEFVRYRALVLLTAFNDPGTSDLMRDLMRDRNDRVREVVFKWFERHPDPRLASTLVGMLQTEVAEFVRPALVAALAALGTEAVQRPMIAETARGLDIFRSAVIESLGRYRAAYALDAIVAAGKFEGPLQDDAVLALGRIGGPRAAAALNQLTGATPEAALIMRAARCLLGDSCAEHLAALATVAGADDARVSNVRAAIDGLSAVAQGGSEPAVAALLKLAARNAVRERVAVAIASVALRQPDWFVVWMNTTDDATRESVVALLKDGFDSLDEDFAEEQFFAAVRAAYWRANEGSALRRLADELIQELEF